jgi:uncharacterized protein
MNRHITAIVKPTHECNLACRYCYVEESAEQGRMNSYTLEKMTTQIIDLSGLESVHIIWHGGEPLLMGLDFYKQAVDFQKFYKDKGVRFENSVQTNATLIDNDVLDFCEQNSFHLGSSMDGPEQIHNLTRVYPDGKGSFQEVYRGVKLIQERELMHKKEHKEKDCGFIGGGVITILTRENINKIKELYDFFRSEKINVKVNPLIKSGRAKTAYNQLAIGPADYGKALVELFDIWFAQTKDNIGIDPLEEILGNLMTNEPVGCAFTRTCRDNYISVGPQGDVYPCGRFDGVKNYWLGNINEHILVDMLESRKHTFMAKRTAETVKGCSACSHKQICNAGCMHNAYMIRGNINDKDYYCRSYKFLFEHLKKSLDIELKGAEVAQEVK